MPGSWLYNSDEDYGSETYDDDDSSADSNSNDESYLYMDNDEEGYPVGMEPWRIRVENRDEFNSALATVDRELYDRIMSVSNVPHPYEHREQGMLCAIIATSNVDGLQNYIASGANINYRKREFVHKALLSATRCEDSLRIIEILLENGANLRHSVLFDTLIRYADEMTTYGGFGPWYWFKETALTDSERFGQVRSMVLTRFLVDRDSNTVVAIHKTALKCAFVCPTDWGLVEQLLALDCAEFDPRMYYYCITFWRDRSNLLSRLLERAPYDPSVANHMINEALPWIDRYRRDNTHRCFREIQAFVKYGMGVNLTFRLDRLVNYTLFDSVELSRQLRPREPELDSLARRSNRMANFPIFDHDNDPTESYVTPLYLMALHSNLAAVEFLIEHKATLDRVHFANRNNLVYYCITPHPDSKRVVERLLENYEFDLRCGTMRRDDYTKRILKSKHEGIDSLIEEYQRTRVPNRVTLEFALGTWYAKCFLECARAGIVPRLPAHIKESAQFKAMILDLPTWHPSFHCYYHPRFQACVYVMKMIQETVKESVVSWLPNEVLHEIFEWTFMFSSDLLLQSQPQQRAGPIHHVDILIDPHPLPLPGILFR